MNNVADLVALISILAIMIFYYEYSRSLRAYTTVLRPRHSVGCWVGMISLSALRVTGHAAPNGPTCQQHIDRKEDEKDREGPGGQSVLRRLQTSIARHASTTKKVVSTMKGAYKWITYQRKVSLRLS
jgi:hypothetical protein